MWEEGSVGNEVLFPSKITCKIAKETSNSVYPDLKVKIQLLRRWFSESGLTEVANIRGLDDESRSGYYQAGSLIDKLPLECWDEEADIWIDGIIDFCLVFKGDELVDISGKFFDGLVGLEARGQFLSGFNINVKDEVVELD